MISGREAQQAGKQASNEAWLHASKQASKHPEKVVANKVSGGLAGPAANDGTNICGRRQYKINDAGDHGWRAVRVSTAQHSPSQRHEKVVTLAGLAGPGCGLMS